MTKICQPYTCLFDISRELVDGRTYNSYKQWLKKTIELFPGIVVFCETIDKEFRKLDANFVTISLSQLESFKSVNKVHEVLRIFKPNSPEDITFRLPEYALIQFSKFELAMFALSINAPNSLLWVDAGISRFMSSSDMNRLNTNVEFLLKKDYLAAFEIDLHKNINYQKLKVTKPNIGSSKRIISGTSFWINSNIASSLYYSIEKLMNLWLSKKIWDNEQVAMRYLFETEKYLGQTFFILQMQQQTGSIARNLTNFRIKDKKIQNKILYNLLR